MKAKAIHRIKRYSFAGMNTLQKFETLIASIIAFATGGASVLDTIEQGGRLILLGLSIVSVTFIIAINYDNAITIIKKKLKINGDSKNTNNEER